MPERNDVSQPDNSRRNLPPTRNVLLALIALIILAGGYEFLYRRMKIAPPPAHERDITPEQIQAYEEFLRETGAIPDSVWGHLHDWYGYKVFDVWYATQYTQENRYCTVFIEDDNDVKKVCDLIREEYLKKGGALEMGAPISDGGGHTSQEEVVFIQSFENGEITLRLNPITFRFQKNVLGIESRWAKFVNSQEK